MATTRSVNVTIPITWDTHHGPRNLAGTIDYPASLGNAAALHTAPNPTAIVVHCFTCNRKSVGTTRISKELAARGYISLRIDMQGMGDSDGRMEDSTLTSNIHDIIEANTWFNNQYSPTLPHPIPPRILVGHSLGGAAVLRAAPHTPGIRAVAMIGSPYDPAHALETMPKLAQTLRDDATLESIPIPGRGVNLGRGMLDDLASFNPQQDAATPSNHGIGLCILHPPTDDLVPYTHAEQLYQAAGQPKALISLPTADHLITTREYAAHAAECIKAWVQPLLAE